MRVSVLGTGDLTKVPRHTKISEEELKQLINDLGKLIAQKGHEIVVIPDRGIPVEVVKAYKENSGKKVYGIVPTKDKKYGTKHIEPYLKLIDDKIEVDSWYDANGEIAASGDVCIVIGMSLGIIVEVALLKYHYRYLKSKTKLIIFKNTLSTPIPQEIAEEIPITYINSLEELKQFL